MVFSGYLPRSGIAESYGISRFNILRHFHTENHNPEDTYSSLFTAARFTIARTWKQPECPSAEECTKMWHMHAMESYPATRSETVPFAKKWTDLETYTEWSNVSHKEKNKYVYQCICVNLEKRYKRTSFRSRKRHREQTHGHQAGNEGWEGGWEELGDQD